MRIHTDTDTHETQNTGVPATYSGDVSASDETWEVDPSGDRLEVSLELKFPSFNW